MDGETDSGPAVSPYMHVFKRLPVPWGCESWWPQQGFPALNPCSVPAGPFLSIQQLTTITPSTCGPSRVAVPPSPPPEVADATSGRVLEAHQGVVTAERGLGANLGQESCRASQFCGNNEVTCPALITYHSRLSFREERQLIHLISKFAASKRMFPLNRVCTLRAKPWLKASLTQPSLNCTRASPRHAADPFGTLVHL